MTALDHVRAGVMLARDAVKAVSVTAMEALREGATFIGIVGEKNELVDPFEHLDAPIWSDRPPQELMKLAFRYCEELTMREAGNFYHSFKYLPDEQRNAMCAVYAFCRRADDIADGDWADRFPGSQGEMDPEAVAYREQLESLQDQGTILDEEAYLNKITQLFFFRKKLSTCYSEVYSTDPVFLALKETVDRYSIGREVFDDLISGMEDDLYNNRYRSFDELYVYCYRDMGVTTVDTTCPWVTKVWNVVDKQVAKGMTTVIHGKYAHEEAIATASYCDNYIMVKNIDEAEYVCRYILNPTPEGKEALLAKFAKAMSKGFDPDVHLA